MAFFGHWQRVPSTSHQTWRGGDAGALGRGVESPLWPRRWGRKAWSWYGVIISYHGDDTMILYDIIFLYIYIVCCILEMVCWSINYTVWMICTSDLDGSGGIIAYHPAIVMDVSPYVGYQSGSQFRKRTKKHSSESTNCPWKCCQSQFRKVVFQPLGGIVFSRKLWYSRWLENDSYDFSKTNFTETTITEWEQTRKGMTGRDLNSHW